ncbi:hypothetical protein GW758_03580 [Candidatus Falkowbacteria bacterium]|nr:hypothetical protein [Candidatus Falkowbacteria bacterium]
MIKINKKRISICLIALVMVLTLAFLLYKPVIFQEGNPAPLLKGIIQLNFSRDKIVKLDMDGNRYLTKGKNGQEVLVNLLNNQGYEFIDQMGSGYFFKDNNDNALLAEHRQYSRFYSIWSLSIPKNAKEKIDDKLFTISGEFVCLPLKDENIPHNDLCIFGIKNSNSDYYRLQAPSDDKNNVVNKIRKGQKIEISGELTNEESDIYKTLGTIKVSGIKSLYTEEKDLESNLPDSFKANYISFQNYSSNIIKAEEYPKLESWVENSQIECNETPLESSLPLRISKKEINGNKYCIGASSEGAAGSVYTQYAYITVIGDNVYSVQFVARYPNCDNYSEEESIKCQTERESFDLDILVDSEIEKIRS